MALLDFQTALGRLVRASDGSDPLRSLRLSDQERSCLDAVRDSAGYRFTVGVQRSWCIGRAASGGQLTLSILPAELRRRLLNEWADIGGGTSSFIAAEADALLDFVARRLPDPSHELTVCRLERAILRANAAASAFAAPDPAWLDAPQAALRRGRHADVIGFHAELHQLLGSLLDGAALPSQSAQARMAVMIGPGLARLCVPASADNVALWESLATAVEATVLWRGGHRRDDVVAMLRAGVLEYVA